MDLVDTLKYEEYFLITGRGFVVEGHDSGQTKKGMFLEVDNTLFRIVNLERPTCMCGQHKLASLFLLKGIKKEQLETMEKGKEYKVFKK